MCNVIIKAQSLCVVEGIFLFSYFEIIIDSQEGVKTCTERAAYLAQASLTGSFAK